MSKKASPRGNSSPHRGRVRNARLRAHPLSISRRIRSPLTLFRQMTHSRKLRIPKVSKRESYQEVFRGFLQPNFEMLSSPLKTVCQRRKERRQVLFAYNLTGKGAKAKHHKMTEESKVRCS